MLDKIKEQIAEVERFEAATPEALEAFRIKYLGRNGLLNDFFAAFKSVPNDQKKVFGQTINELKNKAEEKVNSLREALENGVEQLGVYGDLTRPAEPVQLGSRHPISLVKNQIIDIFSSIGFNVSEGQKLKMIGTIYSIKSSGISPCS